MKYVADDGKEFESELDCIEYEDKCKKYKSEKQKRRKEIDEAYEKYISLVEAYEKDYEDYNEITFEDLFDVLFA